MQGMVTHMAGITCVVALFADATLLTNTMHGIPAVHTDVNNEAGGGVGVEAGGGGGGGGRRGGVGGRRGGGDMGQGCVIRKVLLPECARASQPRAKHIRCEAFTCFACEDVYPILQHRHTGCAQHAAIVGRPNVGKNISSSSSST